MTNKILFLLVGAILLLIMTVTVALAWPDQPPDKVLISGPGIEGQVEVKDEQALEIFRLGTLEDLITGMTMSPLSSAPGQFGEGYKIVRFFDSGGFDFARLTYFPNPNRGRGYLYFEDGPMLQGDHTKYNLNWLYTRPEGEERLRALLKQLGAKLDTAAPAVSNTNAQASSSGSTQARSAAQSSQTQGAQSVNAGNPPAFSSTLIPVAAGAAGLLSAVVALWLFRVRRRSPAAG